MSKSTNRTFQLAPVAAALLVAFGNTYAQQSPEVTALITPESSISIGAGVTDPGSVTNRFNQYTGINKDGVALIDIDMVKRDDASGTWTTLTGRNLGLDTRELSFSQQKQGDWKYGIDYNEIVRNDPNIIHTGTTGFGSATPTINLISVPTNAWNTANGVSGTTNPGHDEQLKLKRTALGLGGEKWINAELQLQVDFKQEEKKGARMFGRVGISSGDVLAANVSTQGTGGANGGWAILLTPEPINAFTRTLETKLNFNRGNLALTGGYYGSFYTNNNGSLAPTLATNTLNRGVLWNGGGATLAQLASAPVALPPDNQAHQFYFSGTHAYSDTTRTNFKLAYTHATQNVDFQSMGLSPGSASNLGGVVDTTLAQLGLTMRPIKDLSINSSLRFEERMDKTPIVVYNYGKAGTALDATTNWPSGSQTRTTAKVDGVYRLPDGYSLTMGADWERKKSPLPPPNTAIYAAGGIIFRETLDETGLRAGMRKAMAENLNGALSLEYKERRSGEDWKTGANTAGNPIITVDSTANNVFPDLYMDRDRTKLRGNLDWDATERLSFQAVMEHGQDDYKRAWTPVLAQLTPIVAGARTINNDSITLDSSYKITDNWQVTSFLTHSENRWNVNKVSIGDDTKNRTDTLGVSLRGKATARLELGVDLLMSSDVTSFSNVVATSNVGGVGNIAGYGATPGNYLPTITYNTTKLNLSGVYSIDKKSAIKMNVIYQEYKNDDWQWGYNGTPFLYSDNTTVSSPASQSTTFIGAVYQYKF